MPKKKIDSHVNHKIVLQLLNRCSQISILIEFTLIYIFNMHNNTFLFEKYLVIRFFNKHKILYLHIDYIFNLHNFNNKC